MFGEIDDLTVNAPSFEDPKKQIRLGIDASWVRLNSGYHRIQPLFDLWTLVKGAQPPINCIGHHEGYVVPNLPGISAATSLFCGLNRPIAASDNGDDIYVFITNPAVVYRHIKDMVCLAKLRETPKNAVFACYVHRYEKETDDKLSGTILAWEWVKADPEAPTLPQDWQERYHTEKWRI